MNEIDVSGKKSVGHIKVPFIKYLNPSTTEKNVFQIPNVSSHGRTVHARIVYFWPLSHSIIGNRKWSLLMMSLSEGTGHAHINPYCFCFLRSWLPTWGTHSPYVIFSNVSDWRAEFVIVVCTTKQSHQNVRPPTYQ